MNNFIPETPKDVVQDVPYYDDVTGDAGWQGQATTKSIEVLKSEVTVSISRLGGIVSSFQRGQFVVGEHTRDGFRINYLLETPSGQMVPGRIDVAALPVRAGIPRTLEARRDKSLRMALYMLKISIDGNWFLQQLSPGYSALMPWMLGDGGKTISQLWAESPVMKNLLPPGGDNDFVDGVITNG